MKEEREQLLKKVVESVVKEGGTLPELLEVVYDSAVQSALKKHHGNQTQAAMQLKMHRDVLRKYAHGKVQRRDARYEEKVHAKTKEGCSQG